MLFYHSHICLPNWVVYAALLPLGHFQGRSKLRLLPFAATARHMGSWQSLVWINVLTLMGTVMLPPYSWLHLTSVLRIPLGYYAAKGTSDIKVPGSEVEMVSELSPRQLLSGVSTFTFGMTSQFMLMEIIAEMKEPMDMPKAYVSWLKSHDESDSC